MNVYEVTFDATTFIVVAKDEDQLFALLHTNDNNFKREVDRGIVYAWDLRNVESVDIHTVTMTPHIVFTVQH